MAALLLLPGVAVAQASPGAQAAGAVQMDNRPERLEWFRDQGLGLFVHWSVDSQLGLIISHSLAGRSPDYASGFYRDLPQTFNPKSRFEQTPEGLRVSVVRAQRMRDSDAWPLPTVVRLTDVAEAFTPPRVHTLMSRRMPDGSIALSGDWAGKAADRAQFGFEIRDITGEDRQSRLRGWTALPLQRAAEPGTYTAKFVPEAQRQYEVRAVLVHPLLTLYGDAVPLP